MSSTLSRATDRLLRLARAGDDRGAVRLAVDLLGEGADPLDLLLGVVAPAQHEVGERWLRREWNVADEHVATAVADRMVATIAGRAEPTASRGTAVVGCAEGEWHALPARLVAEALGLAGWRVVFLGPSVPPNHLRELILDRSPDVLVLSCTVATNLGGLRRSIAAARHPGLPIVVGGRAIPDEACARKLGADAWAPDARALVSLLGEAVPTPVPNLVPVAHAHDVDDEERREMLDATLRTCLRTDPDLYDCDVFQLARVREELDLLLRCAEAAADIDEPRILADFVRGTRRRAARHRLPTRFLPVALRSLAAESATRCPEASLLLGDLPEPVPAA